MLYEDLLANSNFITITKKAAKHYIINKPESYTAQLDKTIYEYIKNNIVFISKSKKLIGNEEVDEELEPFEVFELYCENPYKHAIMLTNKIHENVGKWVRMETKITHTEFIIQYAFRDIAKIYSLTGIVGKKNINTEQYINPILIEKIRYLPPEIELIDIYHRLYLPNNAEEWIPLLELETKLYQMVKNRTIQNILSAEKEGGEGKGGSAACNTTTCKQHRRIDIALIRTVIFQHFIKSNFILIGGWAKAAIIYNKLIKEDNLSISTNIFNVHEKLQIISSADIKTDIAALSAFLKRYTDFEISYHEHNMYIPKDFRIRRFTVRIHYPTTSGIKEKPLMDIFNAASYELIPYKQINIPEISINTHTHAPQNKTKHTSNFNSFKIGNIYVLLRFAMIDLLIIKMIAHRGKITAVAAAQHLENIMNIISDIKQNKYEWIKTAFTTEYYGIDINYAIYKKLEDLKKENMHRPYIPELALKQKTYKIIY